MAILTIILGVFELAALSVLSGCLVALAALSHTVEWILIIVNPTISYFLYQVNELILLLIVLMARLTSLVVVGMFPCQETNSSSRVVLLNIDELNREDIGQGVSLPDLRERAEELGEESDDQSTRA